MIKYVTIYASALLLASIFLVGCDDYEFPVDINATADDRAYVEYSGSAAVDAAPGSVAELTVLVRPTSRQQDVEVEFTILDVEVEDVGTAEEGVDYQVVANPFTIEFEDPDDEANLDSGPVEIQILEGATPGRVIRVQLTGATADDGTELRVGRTDQIRTTRDIVIQ